MNDESPIESTAVRESAIRQALVHIESAWNTGNLQLIQPYFSDRAALIDADGTTRQVGNSAYCLQWVIFGADCDLPYLGYCKVSAAFVVSLTESIAFTSLAIQAWVEDKHGEAQIHVRCYALFTRDEHDPGQWLIAMLHVYEKPTTFSL